MPNHLHHVVMCSHSADTFITFLTDVVGMDVQSQFPLPGEVLETTLGWPPSDGATLTMLGSGDAGLIEVLDVPAKLRDTAPEGLAALSFMADDYHSMQEKARGVAGDVTVLFDDVPGIDCSSAQWAVCRWNSWAAMTRTAARRRPGRRRSVAPWLMRRRPRPTPRKPYGTSRRSNN